MTYHHVHMPHEQWPPQPFSNTDERITYLIERYTAMSVESAAEIGQALRLIADADTAPLVFHCIAGKDRTGMVAALTLSLLGVPEEVIIEDYHLSEVAEPESGLTTRARTRTLAIRASRS